jgi:hypothetical protein
MKHITPHVKIGGTKKKEKGGKQWCNNILLYVHPRWTPMVIVSQFRQFRRKRMPPHPTVNI